MRQWGRWRHEISQNGPRGRKTFRPSAPEKRGCPTGRRFATEFFNGIRPLRTFVLNTFQE